MYDKIHVVNKYKTEPTSCDVYIGRGSVFGNPYSHLKSAFDDIIKVETREEAIENFREYFQDAMIGCGCKHGKLQQKVRELIVRLRLGEHINLVCYCAPKPCHGQIIMDYILKEANK